MTKISLKKFIPGIAWFFVILYLICVPEKDLPQISWLNKIDFVDKWIHVGIFCLLTVLFCWPFSTSSFNKKARINYFIKIALAVSVWGLTTEFIQKFFIPGRSFDLLDWAADTIGALIALWFCSKKFI